MEEKYLIVLDLDNTLLRDDNTISDYTKRILSECKKLGCKIAVNTARSYIRSIKISKEIDADFISCFCGNYVCDLKDDVIYNNPFELDKSKKIVNYFNDNKLPSSITNEGLTFSFTNNPDNVLLYDSILTTNNFLISLEAYKLLIKFNTEEMAEFKKNPIYNECTIEKCLNKNTYRIYPKKTNKWNGISKISSYLNNEYKVISFGDDISDAETIKNSFIGVRMENSIDKLKRITSFSTLSNNDDGVAKVLCSYFNLNRNNINIDNIKILDCSLRDGGHINKSKFGYHNIKNFISKLATSNIDIIEMGFLEDAVFDENVAIYPNIESAEEFLKNIDTKESTISLLIQVDKFNIKKLIPKCGKIGLIRVSFHKEYINLGIEYCEKVKKMGYECSINPINFSNYTKEEILVLLNKVNSIKPDYFSIVDTFGTMLNNDFDNKIDLVSNLLDESIKIGIHLHNNLTTAFSSAQTFIEKISYKREIIIDGSIDGIGRAPGNLKTELITYYINILNGKEKYQMQSIYSLLENELLKIKQRLNWNLDFSYCISAFEKAHRTYAEYTINNDSSLIVSEKFIKSIPVLNKGRYNENISKEIYNCIIKGEI